MASEIDPEVLQEFLDGKPEGFVYGQQCQKIIELAQLIQGVH